MNRMRVSVLVMTALMIGVIGCSRAMQSAGPAGDVASVDDAVRLRVTNNNFADMDVFVIQGGMQMRLGFVPGESAVSFALPHAVRSGAPVRIVAVPIGGQGFASSDPLTIFGGETVTFTIQPELALSFAMVRS
jgi:hypothetical protein